MSNTFDDVTLRSLVEESDDLHADAMRDQATRLDEYVEAAHDTRNEQRRSGLRTATIAGGAVAATALAASRPAFAADSSMDVQILQTAASIEVLAIAAYEAALGLPFIGGSSANAVVKAFAQKTKAQHQDHLQGFNAAATRLGGAKQTKPDPKYLPVVQNAKLNNAGDVVALAITLEDVAAETYTKNVSQVSTPQLRQLLAGVAGVEAQHKAVLLAVQALVKAGKPEYITLPPPAAKLPAAAGSVGFPDTFYPTSKASPADEGAVK